MAEHYSTFGSTYNQIPVQNFGSTVVKADLDILALLALCAYTCLRLAARLRAG